MGMLVGVVIVVVVVVAVKTLTMPRTSFTFAKNEKKKKGPRSVKTTVVISSNSNSCGTSTSSSTVTAVAAAAGAGAGAGGRGASVTCRIFCFFVIFSAIPSLSQCTNDGMKSTREVQQAQAQCIHRRLGKEGGSASCATPRTSLNSKRSPPLLAAWGIDGERKLAAKWL